MQVGRKLLEELQNGSFRALARTISLVENESAGYEYLLKSLPPSATPVVGITGPPGAGKSTLTDALIGTMVSAGKKVAVICVDPSSPFSHGALLGDRIRMSSWYNDPNVFIRSLATRGSLGGLHPKIIEITDVIKAAPFDTIIVETVGVGQSEVEIAGMADTTIVVVVPEAGDEVQTMKAGLMEIAEIFVVNKADRPDADTFARNLKRMVAAAHNTSWNIPVVKTIASQKEGLPELVQQINAHLELVKEPAKKSWLLAEKAYHLILNKRMKDVRKEELQQAIKAKAGDFNLYAFIDDYIS